MAKRADSKYLSGARTDNWLKIKTSKRQEVVIAGFTAPRRTRPFFGALALAVREKNGWRYIGHVGTGFSHKTLEELHGKLIKLKDFEVSVCDEGQGRGRHDLGQAVTRCRGKVHRMDDQRRNATSRLSRPSSR